jgi:hypothetical protein
VAATEKASSSLFHSRHTCGVDLLCHTTVAPPHSQWQDMASNQAASIYCELNSSSVLAVSNNIPLYLKRNTIPAFMISSFSAFSAMATIE